MTQRQNKPNKTMTTTTETKLAAILSFAQSHDWCATAELTPNGVRITDTDGQWIECGDMATLRAWAGY